jgi:hypothetical protein
MIFNGVAGLEIGTSPRIIEANMKKADAAVRYPFLWNAPKQDQTQWPGFSPNGDDVTALGPNVGEVLGVFGVFHPVHIVLDNTSVNFRGLLRLENLVKKIEPPKWPWGLDVALLDSGRKLFKEKCTSCHEAAAGTPRACNKEGTWKTLRKDVGTDDREYTVLTRSASTGVLEGAFFPLPPLITRPLGPSAKVVDILIVSVAGVMMEKLTSPFNIESEVIGPLLEACQFNVFTLPALQDLISQSLKEFLDMKKTEPVSPKYEARVLNGIWAAAPYLHNGSVPSLAELLKPPAERVSTFKVGPAYDIENVGLAKEQTKFGYTYQANADKSSGNCKLRSCLRHGSQRVGQESLAGVFKEPLSDQHAAPQWLAWPKEKYGFPDTNHRFCKGAQLGKPFKGAFSAYPHLAPAGPKQVPYLPYAAYILRRSPANSRFARNG